MSLSYWNAEAKRREGPGLIEQGIRNVRRRIMGRGVSSLSTRVSRLAKKLKVGAPCHVIQDAMNTALNSFNTTPTAILDMCSGIAQGDAYNQRHGNKTRVYRIRIQAIVQPGSTSTAVAGCRLLVFRAGANFAAGSLAGAFSQSVNPITNTGVLQIYYDKSWSCAATPATAGFPLNINLNIPIKFDVKYSGAGAGSTTGETVFVALLGTVASGTTAPSVTNGYYEVFFQP